VNILMLNFTDSDLQPDLWERLGQIGDITRSSPDSPDLEAQLETAEALLLKLGMGADTALIDRAPNLRYIGMLGTGYGRIDTQHAAERGIVVTNVADYSTEGVAEFTVAVLLEHLRELSRAPSSLRFATPASSTASETTSYLLQPLHSAWCRWSGTSSEQTNYAPRQWKGVAPAARARYGYATLACADSRRYWQRS
jgi:lactate dehydrogenase-like 2-hydroxyacid dehydrogenase